MGCLMLNAGCTYLDTEDLYSIGDVHADACSIQVVYFPLKTQLYSDFINLLLGYMAHISPNII